LSGSPIEIGTREVDSAIECRGCPYFSSICVPQRNFSSSAPRVHAKTQIAAPSGGAPLEGEEGADGAGCIDCGAFVWWSAVW
jgi:hypothetical protein